MSRANCWLRLCILFTAIVLAGCSGRDKNEKKSPEEKEQPLSQIQVDPDYSIEVLWHTQVGRGLGRYHNGLNIVLVGDRIYAADAFGVVSAFLVGDGSLVWTNIVPALISPAAAEQASATVKGDKDQVDKLPEATDIRQDQPVPKATKGSRHAFVSGGLGVGPGVLLMGTVHGEVIAVSQQDGAVQWRTQLSSEVLSTPTANDSGVFAQAIDGKLAGLRLADGVRIWNYDNPVPRLSLRGSASPVVTNNVVYTGFASGKISAVGTGQGELIWEQRVASPEGRSELERIVDVDNPPLLTERVIYAVSYQSGIKAFRIEEGTVIWEQKVNTARGLALGFAQIYTVESNGNIVAFEAISGAPAWANNELRQRVLSTPVAFGNYLILGDDKGRLYVFGQSNGALLTHKKVDPNGVQAPPVVQGDRIYLLGTGGQLSALRVNRSG